MSYDLFKEARNALSFSQNMRDRLGQAAQGANSFFQAVPGQTAGFIQKTAQETAKMPLRAGGAMVDVGRQAMGQQPLPRTNIPGLGEFATPARNTYDESMQTNDPMQLASSGVKNASMGVLDVAGSAGLANLAGGAKNLAQTAGRHISSAKQVMTEMPGVDKAALVKNTATNIKDAAVREAGQGLYGGADDVVAAASQAGEVLSDSIEDIEDGEEFDDEATAEMGAALGVNKLSQKQLAESRDALHEKIKNTRDINARKKFIKAFKLISKLIK